MQQQTFVTAQWKCAIGCDSIKRPNSTANSCSYPATHLCLAKATCCVQLEAARSSDALCRRRIIVAMALRQSQSLLPRLGALRGLFTQSQAAQGELGALSARGMADRLQCMLCWVRICGSRPVLHHGIVAPISLGSAPWFHASFLGALSALGGKCAVADDVHPCRACCSVLQRSPLAPCSRCVRQ